MALPGKQAFLYVFDRVTGKPVWPMEERPVPKSDVPGEESWPTQPYPSKPPPFARQALTEKDVNPYIPAEEQAQTRARAAAQSAQRSRAACDDLRMRLAARLLELRGVQVDPDVAAWIQRNAYFTADGVPALQVFADPLFFSAMQSDSHARALATDLAHCEGTTRRG